MSARPSSREPRLSPRLTPRLSVVMATFKRADIIETTIRHLSEQDLDPDDFEVVIVDDGSPDDTRAVVEAAASRTPFALSYLRHANRGPGYTQNRGIDKARAPIVLLMADDIFMAPGALRAHLDLHDRHRERETAVVGSIAQSPEMNQSVFLRKWDPHRFGDLGEPREVPYWMFWACNVSVKRDFMREHGMFRDAMGRAGPAAHEDPEVGYRLHLAGMRMLFEPRALGFHYHPTSLDKACARAYERGLNWGEFRRLVPTPEIAVVYHVLTWSTLGDHLRALSGRRQFVLERDRNLASLLLRHLLKALIFNRVTVPLIWIPLIAGAETRPWLARFVRPAVCRGVIQHHFVKGCRDGGKMDKMPLAETKAAQ